MELERALVLAGGPDGSRWLGFRHPEAVHVAREPAEVAGVIAAAQEAERAGRWVVLFLAYDAAPAFEPAMEARRHPTCPLAVAGIFARPEPADGPRPVACRTGPWRADQDEAGHARAVDRVREAIGRGDVYQANLTFRLRAELEGDPEGLFTQLVRTQGPSYAAYLDLGDAALCSASPELLLARRGDRLTTRPMKGTARREADPVQDRRAAAHLLRSDKERAENTMIVDVARNDLGRIARVGSLTVDQLHVVEHYPTVHQLTSSVSADSGADLGAVLAAVFPAASITGAPKIRATQLIAELEGSGRGAYCGTVGLLGPEGWQLNVAIRTAWVDRRQGTVEYGVGGGIVWDSRAAAEWAEAWAKAAALGSDEAPYELLETMRWESGTGLRALARHRARLLGSARFLGFDLDEDRLDDVLRCLDRSPDADLPQNVEGVGGSEPSTAPELPRTGPAERRVRLRVDAGGRCGVDVGPAPPWGTLDHPGGPWRAALAPRPMRSDDVFCRHKTTHRAAYDHLRADRPDVDEVICWDERGRLTETTVGNLVLELDGRLVTPSIGATGLLAGTVRAALVEEGVVVPADVPVDRLGRATRVWTVNAVRGWVRLEVVDPPPPAAVEDGRRG